MRGDEQAELEVGRQVARRHHGHPVRAAPDHAVELGAGGPELSRQLLELVVAPLPGMGGRPAGRALLARLEPDLALELDVGQAAVAGLGPSVYGGPAHADLGAVERRDLVGRQPAGLGVPDGGRRDLGPLRVHVYAPARLAAAPVRGLLRDGGVVDVAVRAAAAVAVLAAAVADPRRPDDHVAGHLVGVGGAVVAGVAPRAERALPHAFDAHADAPAPVPFAARRLPLLERAHAPVLAGFPRHGRRAPADRALSP